MEIQLQELIDRIKQDGVAAAETEAASILEKANAQAKQILTTAEAEAAQILAKAKDDTDRMVKSGEEALRQAARNLLLSFRQSVAKELDTVTKACVNAAYSQTLLTSLIEKTVTAWVKSPDATELSVLLSQEDLDALQTDLLAALQEKGVQGITLLPSDRFNHGFRILMQDGNLYYDYSAEAVTELLSSYLNPKIKALLKEAQNL